MACRCSLWGAISGGCHDDHERAAIVTRLRIALVCDALTHDALQQEATVIPITPFNARLQFAFHRPDFLLVESAWQGHLDRWKYRIAAYPDHPHRNNRALARVVSMARDKAIPTVFWNKEDGVHFDRFIDSAKLFNHVFTVDQNSLSRYRAVMGPGASVHTLMFSVQPAFHYFRGFDFKYRRANFVGSYGSHVHQQRRARQHMLFGAASQFMGLTVFDRNSMRKAHHYRFPVVAGLQTRPAVGYAETAQIYRDHLVSLNVNTVEDSPTMFSRRLVEILACGGIAVTTPALSVDRLFGDFCHVVRSDAEADELFARLEHGPSADDLARADAGARAVRQHHTWAHRLQEIRRVVGV